MAGPAPDLADIQGLVKAGFGGLTEACFLLATIRDAAAARRWLGAVKVCSIADMASPLTAVRQVAVSAAGLRALGVAAETLAAFSPEFQVGMAGDPARSRRLGDVGDCAPSGWAWGGAAGDPHLAILLYAAPGGLAALRAEVETDDFKAAFDVTELATADMGGREPFGFVDGISQPALDWQGARTPGAVGDLEFGNLSALGEVVLGYPNEYGRLTDAGLGDFGRNGTYLVMRQLDQDVRGFWRHVTAAAGAQGRALAEAMVGRRLDGAPLVPAAAAPIAGIDPPKAGAPENRFTYVADPQGLACPVGAHVRRANPRTADMPGGIGNWLTRQLRRLGLLTPDEHADRIAATRFHRILRRGREYGRPITPEQAADPATDDPKSGLHFICLVGNIARQFEFVQGAWAMNPRFAGLSGEQDPLLGHRQPFPPGWATDGFTAPRAEGLPLRLTALPRFVTVRGGAYFFLPGIRALRSLAAP